MPRVIQLISHNQHLFALTDAGEIFQHKQGQFPCEDKWTLLDGPAPCKGSSWETFVDPSKRKYTSPPPTLRRPTSIGSDGKYVPNREPVYAVKAIGWCVKCTTHLKQDGGDFYNGFLGFVYSDGSAGVVARHVSSSESFSKYDIESKIQLRDSGMKMNWLGLVLESDERLKPFSNPEF